MQQREDSYSYGDFSEEDVVFFATRKINGRSTQATLWKGFSTDFTICQPGEMIV